MDLVLGPGAPRTHASRPSNQPSQRPRRSSGVHTASRARRPPAGSQGARIQPVGLGPRGDWSSRRVLTTMTGPACGSMIRRSSRPGGGLHGHHVVARQAAANRLRSLDAARCAPAARTTPSSRDRDLAEVAMDVHADEPHRTPLLHEHWEAAGKATKTDTCSRHTRAGRRGGHEQRRARSPSVTSGLPNRSPGAAPSRGHRSCPRHRTTPRRSFMPRQLQVLAELGARHILIRPHCPWPRQGGAAATAPCFARRSSTRRQELF